jgi:hypothetical protein
MRHISSEHSIEASRSGRIWLITLRVTAASFRHDANGTLPERIS